MLVCTEECIVLYTKKYTIGRFGLVGASIIVVVKLAILGRLGRFVGFGMAWGQLARSLPNDGCSHKGYIKIENP